MADTVTPSLAEIKAAGTDYCPVCKGHGNIWVNWHPTPVTCGHCHGTGVTCVSLEAKP